MYPVYTVNPDFAAPAPAMPECRGGIFTQTGLIDGNGIKRKYIFSEIDDFRHFGASEGL